MGSIRKILGRLYRLLVEADRTLYADGMRRRYDIHPTARWGYRTRICGEGSIAIGTDTYFGDSCYPSAHPKGVHIRIGRGCAIAHNVHFRTTNFRHTERFADALHSEPEAADIVIVDYCWIGNHVYMGPGVTIGENCIIGANNVVAHDVPPDSVVGGVPARVIGDKRTYATRSLSRAHTAAPPASRRREEVESFCSDKGRGDTPVRSGH